MLTPSASSLRSCSLFELTFGRLLQIFVRESESALPASLSLCSRAHSLAVALGLTPSADFVCVLERGLALSRSA